MDVLSRMPSTELTPQLNTLIDANLGEFASRQAWPCQPGFKLHPGTHPYICKTEVTAPVSQAAWIQ